MLYEKYIEKNFRAASLTLIEKAKKIMITYAEAGLDLTLRQLYYRLVAAAVIPNHQKQYDNLGALLSDARLAGLLPWDVMVDRTRSMKANSHWDNPASIMDAVAYSYGLDLWSDQENRPIVLVEKEALEGIVAQTAGELDIPYEACKGYFSQSEMWSLGKKCLRYLSEGQTPVILHLGDHDPSGIDMTRDIETRLSLFVGERVEVKRLALNMSQVEQYQPPLRGLPRAIRRRIMGVRRARAGGYAGFDYRRRSYPARRYALRSPAKPARA